MIRNIGYRLLIAGLALFASLSRAETTGTTAVTGTTGSTAAASGATNGYGACASVCNNLSADCAQCMTSQGSGANAVATGDNYDAAVQKCNDAKKAGQALLASAGSSDHDSFAFANATDDINRYCGEAKNLATSTPAEQLQAVEAIWAQSKAASANSGQGDIGAAIQALQGQ